MLGIGMGLSPFNMPGNNKPVASAPQNVDSQKNTPNNQPVPQNETSVLTSNLKTIGELKGQSSIPASSPGRSMEVTNLQSNLAEKVTGANVPYNRITLKDGSQIDIDVDTEKIKQASPGLSEKQVMEIKKTMIGTNKEQLTKLLSQSEGNLPEGMKRVNLQYSDAPNPLLHNREFPDVNYDPDKKSLNIPTFALNNTKETFNRALVDAKNPALQEEKKKLSALGIKWSDPANLMSASEEVEVMKSLEKAASNVPPDKRPKDLPINMFNRALTTSMSIDGFGGMSSPEGVYDGRTKKISISRNDTDGKTPHKLQYLKDTAVHEYGHAVADANKTDVKSVNESIIMTDSHGKRLTDRAIALEENAKKHGHKPDDIASDRTGTIYDKYDPYVHSEGLKDEKGNTTVEKYARTDENEHFAETFREYVNNPERFKGDIKEIEQKLQGLAANSEEYKYLKESLDIKRESYNYFKNQIFAGHEFGKTN